LGGGASESSLDVQQRSFLCLESANDQEKFSFLLEPFLWRRRMAIIPLVLKSLAMLLAGAESLRDVSFSENCQSGFDPAPVRTTKQLRD
jgi:aspartyl-tRNA synthetase